MEKDSPDSRDSELIFLLPEYTSAFNLFVHSAINELTRASDPVLKGMPTENRAELNSAQYTLPSGETLEMPPIEVRPQATLDGNAMLTGDLNALHVFIYEMAHSSLEQLIPQFFQHVSTVADAFGNSVDARGQPLSHDLLLDMFEKKQWSFKDDGSFSDGEMMLVHPETYKKIQELPPRTPEQEQRWCDLIERKRQEFYAGKRTRRIS
jgi:hypothetical protein